MSKLTPSTLVKIRENRRLAWASNPVVPQGQEIVCPYAKCGKIFSKPIALTVRAEGSLETYYACPHCFSRVSVSENLEKGLSEVSLGDLKETSIGVKNSDVKNCAHFIGYLRTRPKDSPIPDECLTCSRILKCM